MALDLSYPALQALIAPYKPEPRTESRAFLAWFLENIYRLENYAAQDAVCDGTDDKGIDGIYIDHESRMIDVLQSKIVQTEKTLGDTQVKEFAGTLGQFRSKESIEEIAATTRNMELAGLIRDQGIGELIEAGYEVRGVLVTNATLDPSAPEYISRSGAPIELRDRVEIAATYVSASHAAPIRTPISFDVFGWDVAQYQPGGTLTVLAPLKATELVTMDGLQSQELFDYNVRQSLGRTKVNKDIERSIGSPAEHSNFLMYHNGITVLAGQVSVEDDKVTISDYVVVNGCQTLTALWNKRTVVTDDLRILTRIVKLDHSSPLVEQITHHSNNQNGIKPRDFQSNSALQLRLRNEFERDYPGEVFYRISRGEESPLPIAIDNELAARVLLAFDLDEPWSSHQTYKLFDDLHGDIFARPVVNAGRIMALHEVYLAVAEHLNSIPDSLFARYTLSRFFLLYLLKQALGLDERGRSFIENPAALVQTQSDRDRLRTVVTEILTDLIVDLNGEVKDREERDEPFDFKRDLKSESAVRSLTKAIMGVYERYLNRGRTPGFGELWDEHAPN